MALVLKDRVKETTTTTGTGTITLAGAVTGFQSFSVVGNANTTYYCIAGQGTSEWEVGIGTYTASGTTLSRDTVLASSNAGSAVNFGAGTKDVFATYPAGRAVYKESGGNVILDVNSTSAALRVTQTGSGNALVVEDATNPDSTPFVVAADGTVLCGATSVQNTHAATTAAVQVHSNVASNYYASIAGVNWVAGGQGSSLILSKSRSGTIGTQTVVQNGDQAGAVYFDASDGTQFLTAAQIQAVIDGTPGTNDMPGRLVFSTTADGASSPTERFRISNFGGWGLAGANYGTSGTQAIVSNGNAAAPTWQDVVTPTASQTLTNKTYNGLTLTAAATGFTVAGGTTSKTLTVSNTLTLAGTDASTLDIGAGGTLGSAAFTASTAYEPAITTLSVAKGGTGTTTSTGSGSVVLSSGPTLVDPTITGTITEDIFTLTDGATVDIDPGNGSIQTLTLAGTARTLTYTNMANGEAVTLMINDGTAGTITTWNATFVNNSANPPTLSTSAYTVVVVWKVASVVYAAVVGNA